MKYRYVVTNIYEGVTIRIHPVFILKLYKINIEHQSMTTFISRRDTGIKSNKYKYKLHPEKPKVCSDALYERATTCHI